MLIRAALRKGLSCVFLPEKVIQISSKKVSHYFLATTLPCNDAVASELACNKYFLRRLLKSENLPTPRTLTLRHYTDWKNVLKSSLSFPLAVKPVSGSHANGSSMNITTPEELQKAVKKAFTYIKKNKGVNRILVEEFFTGHDLRFLVVGNQVVSVVKREPAYVIGNGHKTIRQLIHAFNNEWRSSIKYDLPLCPIPIDHEVSRYLAKKKLTLNSILSKGKKVHVRWNANVSTGGRPIDITNQVHPNLKKLAIRIAKLSHLEVGGVDILCKDFTSSDVSTKNISILEINESPGFDIHHFPFLGTGRDVCTAILNHIFEKNNYNVEVSAEHIETLLKDIQVRYDNPVNAQIT